jgi:hypothetical protein
MPFLQLIPGLIAAFLAWTKSPAVAFLDVYLPVMLLLPEYYRWVLPGLPTHLTFSQVAVLPIAAVYFLRRPRWRFSPGDLLVLGFALQLPYSEFRNAGYDEAQNLMFDMAAWIVLPYALTKALVEPLGLRAVFARRLVFLLFCVSVASIFEFRLGTMPPRLILDRFFPGQGTGWVTTFRWGFARVAGPYGHAILAGIIFMIGFRIQRWLDWSGLWEPKFRKLPALGLSKARAITLGLFVGLLITMVRGPWIGAILAAGVTAIGRSQNRKRAFLGLAAAIVFVGVPAGVALYKYAAVGRAQAKTPTQETAAYRKELIDKYVAIALQRKAWGWGRNTWPKVDGMRSIDNYYLLLTLMHGLTAVILLLTIFVATIVRLLVTEMRRPPPRLRGSSLGFTLAGIYVGIAFSIATVYMGNQLIPLFAVLTGWSEGYMLSHRQTAAPEARIAPATLAFRRVVA